jgi:hypothetical protein
MGFSGDLGKRRYCRGWRAASESGCPRTGLRKMGEREM